MLCLFYRSVFGIAILAPITGNALPPGTLGLGEGPLLAKTEAVAIFRDDKQTPIRSRQTIVHR